MAAINASLVLEENISYLRTIHWILQNYSNIVLVFSVVFALFEDASLVSRITCCVLGLGQARFLALTLLLLVLIPWLLIIEARIIMWYRTSTSFNYWEILMDHFFHLGFPFPCCHENSAASSWKILLWVTAQRIPLCLILFHSWRL